MRKINNSYFPLQLLNRKKEYIFLFILLFSFAIPTQANESTLSEAPIFIDGDPINTKYLMRNGHLLVPALFLKNTGATVDWDAQYRSIVFQSKNVRFAAPLGKNYTDDYIQHLGTWVRNPLATATIEFGGDYFVPIVDIANKLGMKVKYDFSINRTFITTNIASPTITYRQAESREKLVAITYDDGPEDYYTPQILDILKDKGVPATFFVLGKQVKANPDLMERIVKEGHGLANHSYNHPDLRKNWSSVVRQEILSTQDELQRVVGKKPDLFRPPYGAYTKADAVVLNQIGMRNILWNVDTLDWSGNSAEDILSIIKRDTKPGAIILQHNFKENRMLDGAIEALPQIIDELKKQGYKFVTIQTLLSNP
ncbi:polysaccharide deacetylase family protein [Bacillus sp. 31A1R]|uniref:Polysaccharide deacetylase family protein n=1 Tax=Robertmurraya mangrovi TaxID=3098077 RepID=A0ABU5IY20_9BACI|nr:polysaccharide deacetylase family protein [Bacillus sp. 31A1R]MDZ5472026.1 polysaccharide deacetylase family protein [Bacillus sp. 31A1R]